MGKDQKGERALPRYVTRHSRDGVLYFQRRGWPQKKLATQFPEGAEVLEALHEEIAAILEVRNHPAKLRGRRPVSVEPRKFFDDLERSARSRSTAAGREYRLPSGWAEGAFEAQRGVCAGSGLPMRIKTEKHDPWAASIDRVDTSEGYTPGNCRLVTYIFNCAQNQFTEDDLLHLCRALVKRADQ